MTVFCDLDVIVQHVLLPDIVALVLELLESGMTSATIKLGTASTLFITNVGPGIGGEES